MARAKYGRKTETDGPGGRETDGIAPETERQRKMDLNQRQTGWGSERQADLSKDRLIESETDVQGSRDVWTDSSK